MPFIISRVSTPITKEQETELKSRLGKAIELVPGKSEEYLLLGLWKFTSLYKFSKNVLSLFIIASLDKESMVLYNIFLTQLDC